LKQSNNEAAKHELILHTRCNCDQLACAGQWIGGGKGPHPRRARIHRSRAGGAEDAVSAWIDECCERDPNGFATSTHLFGSWSAWVSRNGETVLNTKKLANTLETKGLQPHRTKKARGFYGLRILLTYEQG